MNQSTLLRGRCHCGKVRVEFGTSKAVGELVPRICECSFCSAHGASWVFDSEGSLGLEATGGDTLGEYRQGMEIVRFLLCRRCGVLVAALFDDAACSYGAVNARCLEGASGFAPPQLIPPRTLSGEQRRRMWAKVWTPGARVVVSGA